MVKYIYIDGASLRGFAQNVVRKYFGGGEVTFDLSPLLDGYDRGFFYDAFPSKEPDELEEAYLARTQTQRAILERAAQVDRLHIYEGDVRRRSKKRGREQKMVDVMLTVDMMRHANRNNVTEAAILTGDQDFTPVVRAVVDEGVLVTVLFPPGETSEELLRAADFRRPLTLPSLWNLFSPASRAAFPPPSAGNQHPMGVQIGQLVRQWEPPILYGGRKAELWKVPDGWLIKAHQDNLNELNVRHANLDLLLDYLPGVMAGLDVPADLREAANAFADT